jgi:hypothetical protein
VVHRRWPMVVPGGHNISSQAFLVSCESSGRRRRRFACDFHDDFLTSNSAMSVLPHSRANAKASMFFIHSPV